MQPPQARHYSTTQPLHDMKTSHRRHTLHALCLLCSATLHAPAATAQSLTQYVDPRIGTGLHGHVFVGANVPFGMVTAGPTQSETGWDWCSGYHYSGTRIVGFAQTHLSGTGCSDLGDVAIMPFADGSYSLSREGLATPYCHDNEEMRPGYYSVLLGTDRKASAAEARHYIRTEITANRRNAMYRITYPDRAAENRLVVDLVNGVGDRMSCARLTMTDDSTCVGFRISHGWAREQHCYFAMRFSRPVLDMLEDDTGSCYYQLLFEPSAEPLTVTIALSPVSEAGAMQNMVGPYMTFDAMRCEADEQWNRNLGRVQATFSSARDRRIFYTAMYHFMMAPQTWDDENGDWRGADNKVRRLHCGQPPQDDGRDGFAWPFGADGTTYLTTLSLWDTYRAAAPLSTIILPEMMPSVAETYLRIFSEQGKLPVWHLMSQETNCMVGCPAVPVLADLLLKGYTTDTTRVWQAITQSLLSDERGLDDMQRLGYVASDHHPGSLSMSLEYMLACWAAAQVGRAIHGQDSLAARFAKLASGYRHLYDERVGYLRPRDSQGRFATTHGFNPSHQSPGYTEGTPWQYLWLVPHDVEGLAALLGGNGVALQRLDSLFAAPSEPGPDADPDITGLIGQYAHGNEPSHHIAYLYAMLGQPRRTETLVQRIMQELYTDGPDGLCGNEDAGQMSAWYILSALGLYQVEPCGGRYVLGSPLVSEATLHVGRGRTFTIRTHRRTPRATHIRRATLAGRTLGAARIVRHADIMAGGTLDLYMDE